MGRGPTTGSYPNLDKLRHLYADALQLNVIFQPVKGWLAVKARDGSSHLPDCKHRKHYFCSCKKVPAMAFAWKENPIWGRAPPCALRKSRRLCNLLNLIVEKGHNVDLTHDLMRLTITFWSSSMRNFTGLCRRICAKILHQVRILSQVLKSPEPESGNGALNSNPAFTRCVNWNHSRYRSFKKTYVPRYIPPHRRSALAARVGDNLKSLAETLWLSHKMV